MIPSLSWSKSTQKYWKLAARNTFLQNLNRKFLDLGSEIRPYPRGGVSLLGYQFHTAVLRASLGGGVGGDEVGLAIAVRGQTIAGNAFAFEIVDDRVRAPLRQFQIVGDAPDCIAITIDVDIDIGMLLEDIGCFVKYRLCVGPDPGLVEIEVHAAQHDPLLGRRRRSRRGRRRSLGNHRRRRLDQRIAIVMADQGA